MIPQDKIVLKLRKIRDDLFKYKDNNNIIKLHASHIVTPLYDLEREILNGYL